MAGRPAKLGWTASLVASLVLAGCQSRGDLKSEDRALYTSLLAEKTKSEPSGAPASVAKVSLAAKGSSGTASSSIRQAAAWDNAADAKATPAAEAEKIPASPGPVPNAPLTLGLPEAIETGLSRNPDLITLRESENVSRAIVGVAETYPFNPTVQARILPSNRNQNGTNAATYNYVLVWQQFELAHQRRYRAANAAALLDGTRWNVQQAELTNMALTSQLYFAALYQRGLHELADMTAAVNDKLLAVMEKRGRAGQASAAEVAMVRFDTRSTRQQAQLAAITYQNAVLALRRQLNVPPETPLTLEGELTEFSWSAASGPELCRLLGDSSAFANGMDQEALAAQLASRRPDVLAARANTDATRANVRLARALRVPNLWLGPFYSRDSEAIVSLGFQAQMDIPVVNTGKPLVRQRQAELRQQATLLEQLEAKARVEARTALDRYERARLLYEQTRGEASQQVPEELQKLEAEFKRGEIDILRITQMRNSLILFRRTYLDSLNELAQAAAAVTAATGLPPAALVCRPRTEVVPMMPQFSAPPQENQPVLESRPAMENLPAPMLSVRPAD